ncbi:hypothetical protein EAI99_11935 [Alistipes onderdonkii]|nr:hypothetical protein EAI99_11935 [Alistipes onderdonkii]
MLLLAATTACSKETGTGVPPRSESSIDLVLDYENREYELGDVIEATLTITEKKAAADYFCLNTSCNGGKAVATVDGVPLQWQAEQQIPYEIVNEEFSSKVLHLKITPQAGETAEQPFSFGIYVASADGDEVKDRIYANSINSAPIEVLAVYQNAPIELEEQAAITLSAGKENFNGEFSVKPEITGGDGYLIIDGRNYHTADRFSLQADTPCQILYQPLTSGSHEIRFILSDGICSAEEAVTVEVFNQGGVVKPQNGIYIYTTEGLYFSAARWEKLADKDAFSPEGVAIITDEAKFLLAPERDAGFWGNSYIGPHDQYISLLPDIPWIKDRDEAAKDFDGRKNTEALIRAYEDGRLNQANAARFCYYYEPDEPGKWYLPAAGQMNLVTEHVAEIQKCLELIGGQKFIYEYMDYHYASSTGCDNLSIWCMCFFTSTAPAFNHYAKIASPVKYYPVRDL